MLLERCKQVLGKPFFGVENFLLFNLECVGAMKALVKASPACIDLAVTSPPYNIGKEYETRRSVDEYLDWSAVWIEALYGLMKPAGAFWLNLGYLEIPGKAKAIPIPYLLWNRIPFYLIQEVVWNYGAGVAARTMLSPRNEKFLWYIKNPEEYTFNLDAIRDKNVKYPNQKKHGKLKCNPLGKNPTDVWQFAKVTSGKQRSSKERTPHPAQFPLRVVDRIVKAASNHAEVVIDPFLGSGTTAVAALSNGRKVIGFEINREYCEIAARRVRRCLQQQAEPLLF